MSVERRQARAQLRRDVAVMRKLGVARWTRPVQTCEGLGVEDIFLGPPPPAETKPLSFEDEMKRREREARIRHETMFAASSVRPVLPETDRGERADRLRTVVPRGNAQERDRGPQKPEA